jgi:EF-hand domain-containing family member D2
MAGELSEDSGLYEIYRSMTEIDVDKEGVKGAKTFFEAKVIRQFEMRIDHHI